MTWKAAVDSLADNPVANDTKYLTVTFARQDGSGAFTRQFKLTAAAVKSADQVLAFLADQCAMLNSFDGIAADLTPLVGTEVTPGAGLPARTDLVSMFQCRTMLKGAGLFDQVDAAIKAQGGAALDAWEYSATVHRKSPLLLAMAQMLKLDDAELDRMFAVASQITV